jgi:hypothetical protein
MPNARLWQANGEGFGGVTKRFLQIPDPPFRDRDKSRCAGTNIAVWMYISGSELMN